VNNQIKHLEVSNSKAGFQQLVKVSGAHFEFVMEAASLYNLAFAYYLHDQGGQIAVLNLLAIKGFIQMHLSKGKSDRKDTQCPLRYGPQQPLDI
jgi:transposase